MRVTTKNKSTLTFEGNLALHVILALIKFLSLRERERSYLATIHYQIETFDWLAAGYFYTNSAQHTQTDMLVYSACAIDLPCTVVIAECN